MDEREAGKPDTAAAEGAEGTPFPDAGSASEKPAAKGGGFLHKLGLYLVLILVLWAAGAALVFWWQPGRFTQVGVGAVMVVGAFLIPKRHVDRILAAFACVVLMGALFYVPSFMFTNVVEFTIRGTDRDSAGETYLIHTDLGARSRDAAGEPFANRDAPLLWKVNSTDVQGQADALEGQRVRARVYGFRLADLSKYRNIIWMEHIE